jgi:hypothetical protein
MVMRYIHSKSTSATTAQLNCLKKLGVNVSGSISMYEADQLIKEHYKEWENLPSTWHQDRLLARHDAWDLGMTRGEASQRIGLIMSALSGRPAGTSGEVLTDAAIKNLRRKRLVEYMKTATARRLTPEE